MRHNKFFTGSFLSLCLGTLIYIFFRSSSLKVFSWSKFLGLNWVETDIRKITIAVSSTFPDWILFSFPDSLWVFSYVCLMLGIWKGIISTANLFWISIIPLIAFFSELGQFTGFVQGTFDTVDLAFYIIGSFMPLLLFKQSITYNLKF